MPGPAGHSELGPERFGLAVIAWPEKADAAPVAEDHDLVSAQERADESVRQTQSVYRLDDLDFFGREGAADGWTELGAVSVTVNGQCVVHGFPLWIEA